MPANLNQEDFGRAVRVEFDYTYKANDGRVIKISEGEEYVLIKKSNEDWWQVVDKDQKKPLYVPSAYVKELQHKRFLEHHFFKKAHAALMKSLKSESGSKTEDGEKPKKTVQRLSDEPSSKERMIVITGSREDLSVFSGFSNSSKFSEMRASTDSLDKFIENENPYDIVPLEPLAQPKGKKQSTLPLPKERITSKQHEEEPDYENLADFTSASERYQQPTVPSNKPSQIEPKRGSGGKTPPAVSKKPSLRRSDLQEKSDNTPLYANLQGTSAIKPAIPSHHSPQSSTRVEVLDEGWELQVDNETGNKYYYNPVTGAMRAKPPRKSNDSMKKAQKPEVSVKTSPEPVPRLQNESPLRVDDSKDKKTLRPSPLQRRKTSPARFKDSKKAPFLQRKRNEENISPNENNSNNFPSPEESPVSSRSSSKKEVKEKWTSAIHAHKERQSSHSRASSGTSRSLSPDASIPSIVQSPTDPVPPPPPGWLRERNSDGETTLVNSINGDRWIEFFDVNTGNFYYCNEQTRVTVWDLPMIEEFAPNNTAKGDAEKTTSSRESSTKHERTSSGPLSSPSAMKETRQSSIRKSKTLDRDSFPPSKDSEFGGKDTKSSSLPWPKKKAPKSPPTPPSANLKPRKGRSHEKNASKRMLHSQSMIILDDNIRLGMYSSPNPQKDEENQSEETRDDSTERGSLFAPPPHPMIERQGRLNWTKLTEAGKKTKKNWVQQWVVLLANNLLFYKDQKQAIGTKANPLGKPESSCDLRGAAIQWAAKDKSSKKHVFEVSTVRGFCFLLQHDDYVTIHEWYKSIEATIKRAEINTNMLSVEMRESEQLLVSRSQSFVEPYVTSRARSRRSQTLGRVLSSEGLDLGLPGKYRFKSEDDDVFVQKRTEVQMRKKPGRRMFSSVTKSMVEFNKSLVISEEPRLRNGSTGTSDVVSSVSPPSVPPKKPPRNKLRKKKKLSKLKERENEEIEHPLLPTMHAEAKEVKIKDLGVETVIQEGCEEPAPVKPQRRPKEGRSKESSEVNNSKSSRSKIALKEIPKRLTREELKASLSSPFDFKKITPGKMVETQPIDLLQPHWSKTETGSTRVQESLPDLPSRELILGHDDSILSMSAIQGPDILSHLNKARFRNQPIGMEKYHTMAPRSRVSTFSGYKKTSWFSRHLGRKKHNKDNLYQPLLWNQVEPLDQGLMVRKDSRGSTEDESMDNNNHLDVKDKKKKEKDKRKDKDKKGKPPSRHGSDAKQSDKVRNKLRKFISKRPTMESLQERGLIKETVFGCPLHKLCEKEGTNVPKFVKMCVEEVEKRGLNIDGIYRVSGNLSHVQKLRYMVDREFEINLGDHEWEDIHVITGALKMFLRELPEPVIPFTFFDKFIATCKINDKNSRHDATKSLIRALPKSNKETLRYLLQHFCRVVEHSESNRMQVQNIAIVFGPTLLLKPPEMTNHHDPGGGHMAVYMMYQNQIIDYMLTEFKALF